MGMCRTRGTPYILMDAILQRFPGNWIRDSPANTNQESSPELAPLFVVLLFWGSLCFPLTRQNIFFFCWGSNSSQGIVSHGVKKWRRILSISSGGSFGTVNARKIARGFLVPLAMLRAPTVSFEF